METQSNNRACKRCKGTAMVSSWKGPMEPCKYCKEGFYPPVEAEALVAAIVATKGKNKGRIRATMTSVAGYDIAANRAYYVWRVARFHGGKDMTMPVMADLGIRNDPFKPELDLLADAVAKASFGTDMAAAWRWKGLIG